MGTGIWSRVPPEALSAGINRRDPRPPNCSQDPDSSRSPGCQAGPLGARPEASLLASRMVRRSPEAALPTGTTGPGDAQGAWGLGYRELGACCSSWTAPSDRDAPLWAQSRWADPGRRRLRTHSREGLQSNPRKRPLQAAGPSGGEPGHGRGKRRDRCSRVPEVPLNPSVLGAAPGGSHSPSTSASPAVCGDSRAVSVVSAHHTRWESRTRQAPCPCPAPPAPQDSQLPLTKQRSSSAGLRGSVSPWVSADGRG